MIVLTDVTKNFGDIKALHAIDLSIREGEFFGLLGTNGAGKSTLLRMIAGVQRPDAGAIAVDGESVWDNPKAKGECFFIPDEGYFFANSTAQDMMEYYRSLYVHFDVRKFQNYMEDYGIDTHKKITAYSKGMKKQLQLLLGMAANTRYLLCDESFDGLDPVMRQAMKRSFAEEMFDRNLTPIMTTHNMRELEDICDRVGLLHSGGLLFARKLEDLKQNLQKVQCVFENEAARLEIEQKIEVLSHEVQGKLHLYTFRGNKKNADYIFKEKTSFYENLPLSLEEIFISETEVAGYDVKRFIQTVFDA